MSNAQPFTRGLLIYNRVREVPFDIPQGYVKGHSIYRRYMEELRKSLDVGQVTTTPMFYDIGTRL